VRDDMARTIDVRCRARCCTVIVPRSGPPALVRDRVQFSVVQHHFASIRDLPARGLVIDLGRGEPVETLYPLLLALKS